MKYIDHRYLCLLVRSEYYHKWGRLFKWSDGTWQYGIIIGKYRNKVIMELNDGGIHTVDPAIIYPWVDGYENKRWRKEKNNSMYHYIIL